MVYIIIEIQKMNSDSCAVVPPTTFTDQTGARIKDETYYHGNAD